MEESFFFQKICHAEIKKQIEFLRINFTKLSLGRFYLVHELKNLDLENQVPR